MTSMSSTGNIFLSHGVRIQTGSNEPFWVNDAQHSWFVQDGSVDVFIVPLADGKPAGPRSHLLRGHRRPDDRRD